ncbi:uncharacterized protein LOC123501421 [Portunus trituberculatus]|uniref:uncharacterized protein LOC123501421 n=1 Tax=Portunus trituberculatus TaxID=210409 RepID=UPI001E1CC606|nr:uncharacterized protein LOC123501421 [Portunus trituberculatus]
MMDHLPVEISVHILSFLSVADLICVSRVNKRFSELVGDQHLLRHLDLRQAYSCSQEDLKILLRPKIRCHMVHTLDMDAVYWFRPPFDTIARMKNLKSLHLRGISITFKQLHCLLTAGLPLQELSIDWPKCSQQPMNMIEEMQEGLSHLKFLCLTVQSLNSVINQFLKQCHIPFRLLLYCSKLHLHLPSINRLDIIFSSKLSNIREIITLQCKGSNVTKKNQEHLSSLNQVTEVVYDSLSVSDVGDLTATLSAYPRLKGLQIQLPKQYVEIQSIFEAVSQLLWLRLHMPDSEKEKRKGYVQSITNLHHLTHLSLPAHILCETCSTEKAYAAPALPHASTPNFKRPRLGVSNKEDADAGILNLIIDNCPHLTLLEIGVEDAPFKSQAESPIYWHSLKNIRKLEKLTHLTLCNIPVTNGSFLHEIAAGCSRLKFLKLANLGPSGKCCYLKELADSVPHMANLTHFSIHQQYIAPATALLTALKRCHKLQRFSITSLRDMLPINLFALEQLIKEQSSLIFVALESVSTPMTACYKFTQRQKFSRPALVVLAYNKVKEHMPSIPLAHHDMIDLNSSLCGSFHLCYHQDFPFRHYVLHNYESGTYDVQQ